MMITLLKHFTFAADNGGLFRSEWVRIPEGNQNWQLVFEIHSRIHHGGDRPVGNQLGHGRGGHGR